MRINSKLKKYIENEILPEYRKNEEGHGIDHIKYVIDRSKKIVKNNNLDVNINMVYTIAAYHDIGHYIDYENHEKVSAKILLEAKKLKEFFSDEELKIMSDAIIDHRSCKKGDPRSIYGKIMVFADRNVVLDNTIKRTYTYRLEHMPNETLDNIIEDARLYILDKYGENGYIYKKMYFEDSELNKFLDDAAKLVVDKEKFRKRFMKVNGLNNKLKLTFDEIRRHNPKLSLDEVLYRVYDEVKDDYKKPFDVIRNMILEANNINELEYYTKDVNQKLKDYIKEHIFPEYKKNDGGHNLAHILEVIRRCFALNDTYKLGLDHNMIYAIASCHDWGKYIDHETHNLIAAKNFMNDNGMKKFFTDEERKIIKEAIEDHRSSKEDEPRSVYGKLISSADRNTRIEIVFIRSFFVAHERMPEEVIEDYLDYTIKRLSKRYSEENPENMFFEDETYRVFLEDMRNLLKQEDEFKNRYCEVNNITSRTNKVKDEPGNVEYLRV